MLIDLIRQPAFLIFQFLGPALQAAASALRAAIPTLPEVAVKFALPVLNIHSV